MSDNPLLHRPTAVWTENICGLSLFLWNAHFLAVQRPIGCYGPQSLEKDRQKAIFAQK
jgi:hypothetical protein